MTCECQIFYKWCHVYSEGLWRCWIVFQLCLSSGVTELHNILRTGSALIFRCEIFFLLWFRTIFFRTLKLFHGVCVTRIAVEMVHNHIQTSSAPLFCLVFENKLQQHILKPICNIFDNHFRSLSTYNCFVFQIVLYSVYMQTQKIWIPKLTLFPCTDMQTL